MGQIKKAFSGIFADNLTVYLLQFGLAFVFLYAAGAAFMRPGDWIGYMPRYLDFLIPTAVLLKFFSSFEIILAIWIISGRKLFFASIIGSLMLAGITITNLAIFDVTFRDVGLLCSALALTLLSYKKSFNKK